MWTCEENQTKNNKNQNHFFWDIKWRLLCWTFCAPAVSDSASPVVEEASTQCNVGQQMASALVFSGSCWFLRFCSAKPFCEKNVPKSLICHVDEKAWLTKETIQTSKIPTLLQVEKPDPNMVNCPHQHVEFTNDGDPMLTNTFQLSKFQTPCLQITIRSRCLENDMWSLSKMGSQRIR